MSIIRVPPPAFQKIKLVNMSTDRTAVVTVSLFVGWKDVNESETYDEGEEVGVFTLKPAEVADGETWEEAISGVEEVYRAKIKIELRTVEEEEEEEEVTHQVTRDFAARTVVVEESETSATYGQMSYQVTKDGDDYFFAEGATYGAGKIAEYLDVASGKFEEVEEEE